MQRIVRLVYRTWIKTVKKWRNFLSISFPNRVVISRVYLVGLVILCNDRYCMQFSVFYRVDIYWWGLRNVTITKKPCMVFEMETTTIKSDVIVNEKSICNFPNGRISQIFEGIVTKEFRPPLFLKLYEMSTFGRTIFLGSNIVQNPMKYFVNWMSHNDRELSLRSASLSSANLYQGTQYSMLL